MNCAGIYIHVPFCRSRCIYCDFYSTTAQMALQDDYVDALRNEMMLRSDYLGEAVVSSVYIGGGTPSVLGEAMICSVLKSVREIWRVNRDVGVKNGIGPSCCGATHLACHEPEITIEVNPDDVTKDYAALLYEAGVNRVSMGVQTFNDEMLHFLHRRHDSTQVSLAVEHLRAVGIDNISIDLIYGLPGQTLSDFERDLEAALCLPIKHLSAYMLSYEQGTRLYELRAEGLAAEASDELSLSMFQLLMERTAAKGMLHYELSNFAYPDFCSRHNSGYWQGMHYIGLGPAAHSYNGRSRSWNAPSLTSYVRARGNTLQPSLSTVETLTPRIMQEEMLLTRLRTAAGLGIKDFYDAFGIDALRLLLSRALPYLETGVLAICDHQPTSFSAVNTNNGAITSFETYARDVCGRLTKNASDAATGNEHLCLTESGLFVSDDIISSLFAD